MQEVVYSPHEISPGTACRNCGEPRATLWWSGEGGTFAAVHGMAVPWCDLCAAQAQLKHARERAAEIPALEAKVARLEAEDQQPRESG